MISYLEERLYSEAFEEGFNYAVEKMFARKFINPKNIPNQRITRKGKGDILSGDAFYKKVKSMQPRTHTVDEIDAIPLDETQKFVDKLKESRGALSLPTYKPRIKIMD